MTGFSSRQKHTEGVTRVAVFRLRRSPGWVPLTASPHPRRHHTPQEMQGNTFNDVSSKGAFLLTALLESNCATPVRFWGSKPLFISAFSADCRTHACPPLQSNHGPSQRPGFCLFSHSGGSFHALGTPSSPKHTFQCALLAPSYYSKV